MRKGIHLIWFLFNWIRELELLAIQVRQEQQKTIKAIRHDRLRTLSNALLLWKQWIAMEKQEKLIRIAHERRALKMQQFLLQLQNRHLLLIEEPLSSLSKKMKDCLDKVEVKNTTLTPYSQNGKESDIPDQPKNDLINRPKFKKSQVKTFKPSKSDQQLFIAMQEREKLRLDRKADIAKQKKDRQKELEVSGLNFT